VLDHLDLCCFLVRQLLTAAFGELLNGIAALLDQSTEDLLRLFVIERRALIDLLNS